MLLNDLMMSQLNESFGNDWIEGKIGYVMSMEKLLLDTVIGSKEILQELLFESGILHNKNDCRKARIVVQGEGICLIPHNI